MQDLDGKVAFVTGAGSGIGLGIATALAQAGVRVMLCDINKAALDAAVEGLKATNADVDGVLADVSLKDQLQSAADATLEHFGKVHILVNNAGVGGGGDYGTWNDPAWRWVIGVNLMSVVWGFEIFGPLIESHGEGGHIVSTASIAGMVALTNPSYDVTKFGVVALSEDLRPKLAARGIGVSVLCPGVIRTNILESSRNIPDRFQGQIPSGPIEGPGTEVLKAVTEAIASGIDPLYVGELVREAIEGDWPHIFTDLQFEPVIEARFDAIKAGFDRIRGRTPRY
ncbi:SDR family NAD(P)-dependent oxidoreductase [Hyphomonas sp.]|uniref:SDR family NAD(P)-dependent oxidoreductase n=1 Tax=Hyphomonas sp. TaxID=87 RepID=UPI003919001D